MPNIVSVREKTNDAVVRGVLYLVFGYAIFSVMDVIIKTLSTTYPAHEIVFLRGLVAMVPILCIVYFEGGWRLLRAERPILQLVRGTLGLVAFTAYYLALAALPLATVTTLFFTNPLFISVLGFIFLREAIGVYRWSAIVAGFVGVVIITKPGSAAIDPAMLLALLAAISYSVMTILTRILARTDAGSTQAFYSMSMFIALSAVIGLLIGDGKLSGSSNVSLDFLTRAWVVPDLTAILLIALAGLIAGVGFYCLSQAYRHASVSSVAPFEYTAMPWAILWGFVFFAEVPTVDTVLGLILIVGSGLFIIFREAELGKRLVRNRRSRLQI